MARVAGLPANVQALAVLINKADARPAMGVKVGGGIHVTIPGTYTQGAVGWLQSVVEAAGEVQYDANKLAALATHPGLTVGERAQATALTGTLTVN